MTTDTKTVPHRVDVLEEHAAHQARLIEELSEQLATQWKTIDELKQKQLTLITRLLELEEQLHDNPPVTRPPHY